MPSQRIPLPRMWKSFVPRMFFRRGSLFGIDSLFSTGKILRFTVLFTHFLIYFLHSILGFFWKVSICYLALTTSIWGMDGHGPHLLKQRKQCLTDRQRIRNEAKLRGVSVSGENRRLQLLRSLFLGGLLRSVVSLDILYDGWKGEYVHFFLIFQFPISNFQFLISLCALHLTSVGFCTWILSCL